jgi:hypothetical protein
MSREIGSCSVVGKLVAVAREFPAELMVPEFSASAARLSRAPAALEPTRPALAYVLLCRFPRQVSQRQRNPSAGPANKALRLRLGAGALAVGLPPEQTGGRKRELTCTP